MQNRKYMIIFFIPAKVEQSKASCNVEPWLNVTNGKDVIFRPKAAPGDSSSPDGAAGGLLRTAGIAAIKKGPKRTPDIP